MSIFRKSVKKIQLSFKSDKSNGQFTRRSTHEGASKIFRILFFEQALFMLETLELFFNRCSTVHFDKYEVFFPTNALFIKT
jgi:hypothetical protein